MHSRWRQNSRRGREWLLQYHQQLKARGVTAGGLPLWSDDELELVKRLYPDYGALQAALPHRSLKAIRLAASKLGISKSPYVWTGSKLIEARKLRRSGLTSAEIAERLGGGLTAGQVQSKLRLARIPAVRRPPAEVSNPLLNAIRQRAFACGFTMKELDLEAGTGKYFQCHKRRASLKRIQKALAVLDGSLIIHWND